LGARLYWMAASRQLQSFHNRPLRERITNVWA